MLRALGLPLIATLSLVVACGDKSETTNDPSSSAPADSSEGGADQTSAPSSATESAGTSATEATSAGSNSNSNSNSTPDSTTTGGEDPTGSNTVTGGFIVEMDGGVSGECDPKLQDCPDGEKCSAVSPAPGEPWGVNTCVPLMGDGQPGDNCDIQDGKYTGLDNCGLGLICLLTDDEGKGGACVEFCDENMTCPITGAKCVVYNDGSLPICLSDCDPLIQDCPAGQACYNSAGDNFVCFKESAMPGEGMPGSECQYINQCQQGSFCANAMSVADCPPESNGCCTPYCPVSGGNGPCQATEECVAFFAEGMAPPGYEDVGVCAIPG
jgi:hypothetical protein